MNNSVSSAFSGALLPGLRVAESVCLGLIVILEPRRLVGGNQTFFMTKVDSGSRLSVGCVCPPNEN